MSVESLLLPPAALANPDNWQRLVQEVAHVLESEQPQAIAALQALRARLPADTAYALDRAQRQANAVVPLTIDGTEVWQELALLPVHLQDVAAPADASLAPPPLRGLGQVERALESGLGMAYASVRLLPFPVDPRHLAHLEPTQVRTALQQLALFGDTTYLAAAQLPVDAHSAEHWWLWPFTVQHAVRPLTLVSGVGGGALHHWQRGAQLLEERLMAWLLASTATGHLTIRPPVSWAEGFEQLQRYKVLAWLSALRATVSAAWTVQWAFQGSVLTLFAARAGVPPVTGEFFFKPGQGAMVSDLMSKAATRFPGRLIESAAALARPTAAR